MKRAALKQAVVLVALMLVATNAIACLHDPAQKRAFVRTHPCPATGKTSGACPGWIVDHVKALCKGGLDRPSNMQWQTTADAKRKDRIECAGK